MDMMISQPALQRWKGWATKACTFRSSSCNFQILTDSQPCCLNFGVWEPRESCPSGGFKDPLHAYDSHICISSCTSGLNSSWGHFVVNSHGKVTMSQPALLILPLS